MTATAGGLPTAPWAATPRATFGVPTLSANGVVAAPHYLATQAGIDALRDGGSAVDAALAANLVLGVVWPHMCGPGGDLFAQVWSASDNRLIGFNGSGRAGAGMTVEAYRALGLSGVPERGFFAVTVPGAIEGWFALHERWGRLEPSRIFRDAIRHAREGFSLSARLSGAIRSNAALLAKMGSGAEVFLPGGNVPEPGQRLVQSDLARSLELIAQQGPRVFYEGELGARTVETLAAHGGLLAGADLQAHRSEWVEPIGTEYRGLRIMQLPPNTQGVTLLEWLNMLEPYDVAAWGLASATGVHQQIERKKLAFADRDRYVADPAMVPVPTHRLAAPDYGRQRAALVGERSADPAPGSLPATGDTVYLCAADRDGNVVSLIQSLFAAFGSGVNVPGTGITLHNRGSSFKLDGLHPNGLAPGKRPMHTLIPGMAMEDGRPRLAFGTRGADGQPQTGVQLLSYLLDFGLSLREAMEAPRWSHGAPSPDFPRDAVVLESRFGNQVVDDLARWGHTVRVTEPLDAVMGTAQMIRVDHRLGYYEAASDPRGDGVALGY